jgi:hypothetical protein
MFDHLGLMIALAINITLGASRIYARWARDWCGWRLARFVALQLAIPNGVLIFLYVHLAHLVPWERVGSYRVPVAFVIAQLAERLAERLTTHKSAPPIVNALTISQRIATKKVDVVEKIVRSPNAHGILCNVLLASDVPLRRRNTILASLPMTPTKSDGFKVMDVVGLNLMKRFVPKT